MNVISDTISLCIKFEVIVQYIINKKEEKGSGILISELFVAGLEVKFSGKNKNTKSDIYFKAGKGNTQSILEARKLLKNLDAVY